MLIRLCHLLNGTQAAVAFGRQFTICISRCWLSISAFRRTSSTS